MVKGGRPSVRRLPLTFHLPWYHHFRAIFRIVACATILQYREHMFRWFRALAEAVQELCTVGLSLTNAVKEATLASLRDPDGDTLGDRSDELERTRALWEAEMNGILLKADSAAQSAKNAESRSRTQLKNAKKLGYEADEGDLPGEAEIQQAYADLGIVPPGDARGSEEEGVLDVHPGLEGESTKSSALRVKFGG